MATPRDFQPPPSLIDLRRSIVESAPDPARDVADFARISDLAHQTIETGDAPARVSELRVRLAGPGVDGHELPVHHAAQILDLIQGAVSAIGSYTRKIDSAKTPKGPGGNRVGVKDATQLRIGPHAAPGSLVFTLRASPVASVGETLRGTGETDAFVDIALRKFLSLLAAAESDRDDAIGELTKDIRKHGAMVASKLNKLADQALKAELSLDLGHWALGGSRSTSRLSSRGAAAIVAAAERSKDHTEPTTLVGRLRTVSDGSDQLRLDLDDGKTVRIYVDATLGLGLGPLLGLRVEAEVDDRISWNLASGRETSKLTLTGMRAAPTENLLDLGQ